MKKIVESFCYLSRLSLDYFQQFQETLEHEWYLRGLCEQNISILLPFLCEISITYDCGCNKSFDAIRTNMVRRVVVPSPSEFKP
jgi:hypothetical protein